MVKTFQNPSGTYRKQAGRTSFVLDGNQIRQYKRSPKTNELSGPKVETFSSVKKAHRVFFGA